MSKSTASLAARLIRAAGTRARRAVGRSRPFDATQYWEERYAAGGDSGAGSAGRHYVFKRDYLNDMITRYEIRSVVDFGCGDGQQVAELAVDSYYGLDVSDAAIRRCRGSFANRPGYRFDTPDRAVLRRYDLALSLDVLYHIVDEEDYRSYLDVLFSHSNFTLVYANYGARDCDAHHMLYRDNSAEIAALRTRSQLLEKRPNPHKTDFGFSLFRNTEEQAHRDR